MDECTTSTQTPVSTKVKPIDHLKPIPVIKKLGIIIDCSFVEILYNLRDGGILGADRGKVVE